MGIIVITCLNWFGAGICAGLVITSIIDKQYNLATLGAYFFTLNAILGAINVNRLLAAVQFVAEAAK